MKSSFKETEETKIVVQVAETVDPFSDSCEDTQFDEACHSHGVMKAVASKESTNNFDSEETKKMCSSPSPTCKKIMSLQRNLECENSRDSLDDKMNEESLTSKKRDNSDSNIILIGDNSATPERAVINS